MSQVHLADEMAARGWPWRQQTVTRVETGRRMVRLGEAMAVAEILETCVVRLTANQGNRVVHLLSESTHEVSTAGWRSQESTVKLLNAKAQLRITLRSRMVSHHGARAGPGCGARHRQQLTPEVRSCK